MAHINLNRIIDNNRQSWNKTHILTIDTGICANDPSSAICCAHIKDVYIILTKEPLTRLSNAVLENDTIMSLLQTLSKPSLILNFSK